ncbi:hypothetical protein ACFYXF_34835 [Streptomyces sp. NPDC002680]|uniref:hypothetical protein n=1 Tax=Streptomyces sp. NPDC002680 TaxID=3364659 RepID=UPI0036A8866A
MSSDIARLAARVAVLERQLARTTRTARLAYSSIENGAVEVFDEDGSLRAIVGQQPDGTSGVIAVNGPPPPTPVAPAVVSVLGGIAVNWAGAFTDAAVVPLDWARLEIHTAVVNGFEPTPATLRATLESPQGGTLFVPAGQPLYVRLVARSTSGTASAPSGQAGPVAPGAVVAEEVMDGIVDELALAEAAVTRNKIAVGAVDADRMAIGTGNLLPDASFEGPYTDSLIEDNSDWFTDSPGNASARCLRVNAAAPQQTTRSLRLTTLPALPGERFFLAVDYKTSADWTGSAAKFYLRWLDATGATLGFGVVQAPSTPATVWTRISGQVRAPANTVSATVWLETYQSAAGQAYFDNAEIRTVVIAGLILAGSVGTPELAADSVVAEKVVAQTLTGREIKFASITGDHLDVNSARLALLTAGVINAGMLDADAINGKTIKGAIITGGVLRTAATGQRVVISPGNTNPETGSIEFYSGSANESAPAELNTAIAYSSEGSVTYEIPSLSLSAPMVNGSAQETGLFLQAHVPGYAGSVFNLYANELSGNGVAYINGYGADTSTAGSSIELHVRDAPSGSARSTATLTSRGLALDGDLSIHGRDQGRGFVAQRTLTANVTFSSTETALITTGSITFKTGRAYRVSISALHSAASDNYALYRIRKNTVAGTIYKDQIRINNLQGSSASAAVTVQTILTNTTGSDITTALCWSGAQGTVAQTWTITASSSNTAYLLVEDCGSADDYSGQAIT